MNYLNWIPQHNDDSRKLSDLYNREVRMNTMHLNPPQFEGGDYGGRGRHGHHGHRGHRSHRIGSRGFDPYYYSINPYIGGPYYDYPPVVYPPTVYVNPTDKYPSPYECKYLSDIVDEYKMTADYEKYSLARKKWHDTMVLKYGDNFPDTYCETRKVGGDGGNLNQFVHGETKESCNTCYGGGQDGGHNAREFVIMKIFIHSKKPEHLMAVKSFRDCEYCSYLEKELLKL